MSCRPWRSWMAWDREQLRTQMATRYCRRRARVLEPKEEEKTILKEAGFEFWVSRGFRGKIIEWFRVFFEEEKRGKIKKVSRWKRGLGGKGKKKKKIWVDGRYIKELKREAEWFLWERKPWESYFWVLVKRENREKREHEEGGCFLKWNSAISSSFYIHLDFSSIF